MTVAGEDAFRLHDTYGFPVELTAELAQEAGLGIDEAGYAALMEEQRQRARSATRRGGAADPERLATFAREAGFTSEFVGYRTLDIETVAGAVEDLGDGVSLVKLHASPFYAGAAARSPMTACSSGREGAPRSRTCTASTPIRC